MCIKSQSSVLTSSDHIQNAIIVLQLECAYYPKTLLSALLNAAAGSGSHV